ncbi:hypothetical protein [Paraburkholderia sp. BL21I4N1]|uniref:hypothetical protein n=1 Tax=Paraburkholderia sp. BL21I4N1 TaxID=1938801 RepID=UPI000D4AAFE5|nr:hypothetical protein [Paraburkholderia sp. BL21I4N1]PQV49883.1 hypothetical protein B0G83_106172 [Paraburkholderia sp. BL21I4N1]
MKAHLMIARGAFLTLTALLAGSACAGQPGADLQSAAAFPPAADKVYPPLPSLAMLPPPSVTDDDAAPLKPTPHRKKSRASVQMPERRMPPAPVVRLIVSDASHAYLDNVQRQIDLAMNR